MTRRIAVHTRLQQKEGLRHDPGEREASFSVRAHFARIDIRFEPLLFDEDADLVGQDRIRSEAEELHQRVRHRPTSGADDSSLEAAERRLEYWIRIQVIGSLDQFATADLEGG